MSIDSPRRKDINHVDEEDAVLMHPMVCSVLIRREMLCAVLKKDAHAGCREKDLPASCAIQLDQQPASCLSPISACECLC